MSARGRSRARVVALVCLAAVPALGALLLLGQIDASDSTEAPVPEGPSLVDRVAGQMLRPGPLSAAHAELEGIRGCLQCHAAGTHVPDERCVACHEEIGVRQARALPLHGTLDGACRDCHTEHAGVDAPIIDLDRAAFLHTRTRFPLDGAHAEVDCTACHELRPEETGESEEAAFHYQGVPHESCASCHNDPHGGRAPGFETIGALRRISLDAGAAPGAVSVPEHPLSGRRCEECHTETSFRANGLLADGFRHTEHTRFALDGAHAKVRCVACHTDELRERERSAGLAPGREASSACGDCHDDPHEAALGPAERCATCHVAQRWSRGFDHARNTRFELDPLHGRAACESCHEDHRFAAAGRDCAACHADAKALLAGVWGATRGEPDPHDGAVECARCHGDTPAANTLPALAEQCTTCHPQSYGPLLLTWNSELTKLAARSPSLLAEAERLRRSGPHNFVYARRLLEALAR